MTNLLRFPQMGSAIVSSESSFFLDCQTLLYDPHAVEGRPHRQLFVAR
jgi:hypothetical protein